ncbi:sulfatase-like hydrolase/transferase [Algibacter miyuki]|uniref:Sulfatase-like hydrolase/transferase n=1 Tax=Algibacter miyuki TaxID=1306933 RepID=A0ABV5H2K6_9FLAO|nr:sulfatase-like hydrolase/transferase [Algibacter miyuki]MDN3664508.1 sulfatase-like hydrolase/transferase [Algibacter miyuki]
MNLLLRRINKSISFLSLFLILTVVSLSACKNTAETKVFPAKIQPPNVIVILVDDAGYADFGFMGCEDLETPNIDRLAKSGAVLTDAHVSATVCAPSRAGLMTGKYQQRFGFEANGTGYGGSGDIGLSDNVVTMADVFKENGYKTLALGKWHLGAEQSDHPNQRGFDEFFGFEAGSRSYFPEKNPTKKKMLQHNGKRVLFDGYLTDVLGDQSVKFVEENKNNPFFMYLAFNAVHTPMEAKVEHLEKYKDHSRQKLAAMTWSLDENVGKLQQKLKDLGLEENTLIYFLSDNGGAANNSSSGGPLKGWKGNKFEGGHRVPFVVSWPKQIKAGQTFDGLSSSLDIFTTALAAADIKKADDLVLDGVNLLPYLQGEKTGDPHEKLFWRKLEEAGARVGDFKLVRLQDYGATLYNLEEDLGETVNLETSETKTYQLLQDELKAWESKMMAPLWGEERSWMDVTYHIHQRLMENKAVLYSNPGAMKNKRSKKQ